MAALLELEHDVRRSPPRPDVLGRAARAERHNFAGRPTPLYRADRLAARARHSTSRIYLKREDLAHTGAHKINNVLGQGLLAKTPGQDSA